MRAALAGLGITFIALAKVAGWQDYADVVAAPGIHLVFSSPEIALYSVKTTAQETAEEQRVRRLDPVDYQIRPGAPGVVALPVAYSPGWVIDGQPAIELSDGQAGVRAPAAGGVAHYAPSSGVLASEAGSVAAALAAAVAAWIERRRRRRAAGRSGPIPLTGTSAPSEPSGQRSTLPSPTVKTS